MRVTFAYQESPVTPVENILKRVTSHFPVIPPAGNWEGTVRLPAGHELRKAACCMCRTAHEKETENQRYNTDTVPDCPLIMLIHPAFLGLLVSLQVSDLGRKVLP